MTIIIIIKHSVILSSSSIISYEQQTNLTFLLCLRMHLFSLFLVSENFLVLSIIFKVTSV